MTSDASPRRSTVETPLPDVEEMRALVADGREKGFLTYDEIVGVLEEAEVSKDQVEDFYSHLVELGVEVLDADGEAIERGTTARDERAPELDLTVEPEPRLACASTCARSARCRCSPPSRRSPSPSASSAATWRPRRR